MGSGKDSRIQGVEGSGERKTCQNSINQTLES